LTKRRIILPSHLPRRRRWAMKISIYYSTKLFLFLLLFPLLLPHH
jgi:hypothetical protein